MLAKKYRLNLKLKENQEIFIKGKTVGNKFFVVYYFVPLKLTDEPKKTLIQVSVLVSKKISNKAVVRNNLKRKIYQVLEETLFKDKKNLTSQVQMVVIAKSRVLNLDEDQLRKELNQLVKSVKSKYLI